MIPPTVVMAAVVIAIAMNHDGIATVTDDNLRPRR